MHSLIAQCISQQDEIRLQGANGTIHNQLRVENKKIPLTSFTSGLKVCQPGQGDVLHLKILQSLLPFNNPKGINPLFRTMQ
jgi:hypothetical protein